MARIPFPEGISWPQGIRGIAVNAGFMNVAALLLAVAGVLIVVDRVVEADKVVKVVEDNVMSDKEGQEDVAAETEMSVATMVTRYMLGLL